MNEKYGVGPIPKTGVPYERATFGISQSGNVK